MTLNTLGFVVSLIVGTFFFAAGDMVSANVWWAAGLVVAVMDGPEK